jgi:predicted MFS family arabinose efflux permease
MSRRNLMLGVLISFFFLSFFYRTSPAVLAPYLIRDFSLGAERLGLLSSIFFYVFALNQIPLGPALDFIGVRPVIAFLGLIGGLGSILFASAPDFSMALLGRGLTGLGMSGMLMGSLMIAAIWYPPRLFATLAGLISALGNFGALTATLPLAFLTVSLGWRGSFYLIAAVNLLLAAAVWIIVRNRPPREDSSAPAPQVRISLRKAYGIVLGNSSFWAISILLFFTSGSFLSIQGLWGGPFLMDVFGMAPARAGAVLSAIAVGYIFASLLVGTLADRFAIPRKKMALTILGCFLLTLLFFSALLNPGRAFLLFPVYLSLGMFFSGNVLLLAHLRELFPKEVIGTALTGANFFSIGGAAALQYFMGWVIERYPREGGVYPLAAYRSAFLVLLVGMAVSLFIYWRAKEKKDHP